MFATPTSRIADIFGQKTINILEAAAKDVSVIPGTEHTLVRLDEEGEVCLQIKNGKVTCTCQTDKIMNICAYVLADYRRKELPLCRISKEYLLKSPSLHN